MKKNSKSFFKETGLLNLQPKLLAILLVGIIITSASLGCFLRTPESSHGAIQVCFSPEGQCTQLVKQTIAEAQDSILVQAYSLSSATIINALIAAHERGVFVKILVDRSQLNAKGSKVRLVVEKSIPISIDAVLGIAHNKVMIIDDEYVLTGSFNWTVAAEYRNAENLLLIRDRKINKAYRDNWEQRAEKAQIIKLADIEN